jgi:hypothetical protein
VVRIYIKGNKDSISAFMQEILDRSFGIDLHTALSGVTIYLGINPYPPGEATIENNKLRPHWNKWERWIVLPPAYCLPGIASPSIHSYIPHEIGHAIHDTYIEPKPNRLELWQEWADTFGYELDFGHKNDPTYRGKDYWHRKTFEDFAIHFERSFRGTTLSPVEQFNRLEWYSRLWGQVLTLRIELPIGEPKMIVNGREQPIDVPAQIIEGRTMVPLRFVSEALGAEVDWEPKNGHTKNVIITKGG